MSETDDIMRRFEGTGCRGPPGRPPGAHRGRDGTGGVHAEYLPRSGLSSVALRAFFDYHDALIDDTELEREEVEMIIVAVSGVNDCLYCVVAHGALLRIYASAPELAEQLATNHRIAEINESHRAMLDFAVKLTENPEQVVESDFERLEDHGFSRKAIWDIRSVAAFFNLSRTGWSTSRTYGRMRSSTNSVEISNPRSGGRSPSGYLVGKRFETESSASYHSSMTRA